MDWLLSSVEIALRGATKYLNKSHPPKHQYKQDKPGWLAERAADEYNERFGIELSAGPNHSRVRELLLARNAGIHREEPRLLEKYLNEVQEPAFVDDGDVGQHFFVKRESLVRMIEDTENFIKWVVSELETRRPRGN